MSDADDNLGSRKISIQFYSDILRMRLLKKYGGFWIDSTMAILDPDIIDRIHDDYSFMTLRTHVEMDYRHVMSGRWTSFFWAGAPGNPFFSYMDDAFTYFIRRHGSIFEYFHIDYTVATGYAEIPVVRKLIDGASSLFPVPIEITALMDIMDEPYNSHVMKNIREKAPLQKLTYKRGKQLKTIEDGSETFYGYLTRSFMKP